MIAAWMAYTLAISCLLGVAALAIERACRVRRWPSRWVWAIAIAAPFALPFAPRVADESVAIEKQSAAVTTSLAAPESAVPPPKDRAAYRMKELAASSGTAAMLGAIWICASVLLAAGLAIAWLRMNRRAGTWSRHNLDGTDVLVSGDIGPAVIGFTHPRIVVPAWLLGAEPRTRQLALAHESEHVRARDPLLLFAATMAVVLMPWNLPLWWQWRRLRFAIEVDCDARVLASGGAADIEYAEALLSVAERSSGVPLATPAMCESASSLERRIHWFLLDRDARQRTVALVLLIGGIGVVAAAGQIDAPAGFGGPSGKKLLSSARGGELVEAIADGDHDAAVALINDGADVDRVVLGDGSPLIVAARQDEVALVNLLLQRGAQVDLPVSGDGNPLIAASISGNLEIMTTLVGRGADVNGFVMGDETPLINAARAGRLEAVRYLVANGADVNLAVPAESFPGAEIRSPLGEAIKHERRAVAEYLRSQGAHR